MSYMVMECHPGYAILLDEEGRFFKAANLRYEVGQTVYDPIFVKDNPSEKKHGKLLLKSGILAAAACFLLFFGINYYHNYIEVYSSVYLAINPQVRMELNRQGEVVELVGTNQDGMTLLEGYDAERKDKAIVADELIDRAIDMGFLSEGGQISFSIDCPEDALFQQYGTELRQEVTEHLKGRITVEIEIIDYKKGSNADKSESGSDLAASQDVQSPQKPSGTSDSSSSASSSSDYGNSDYGQSSSGKGNSSGNNQSGGSSQNSGDSQSSVTQQPETPPQNSNTGTGNQSNYGNDTNYDDGGSNYSDSDDSDDDNGADDNDDDGDDDDSDDDNGQSNYDD